MEPIRVRGTSSKKEDKEKRGAGAPWAPGAGAAAGPGGAGTLEVVGASGSLPALAGPGGTMGAVLQALSRATGLSAAASSSLGIATGLLAAGTLLTAVLLLRGGDRVDSVPVPPGEVFLGQARPEEPGAEDSTDAVADAGPSGIDYFASVNSNAEELSNELPAPAAEAAGTGNAAAGGLPALPDISQLKQAPAQPMNVPKMKPAKGVDTKSSAATQVVLRPVQSLGGKVGSSFQDIYRRGASSAFAVDRSPKLQNRRMRSVVQPSGAREQLLAVNRVSRRATSMGAADGASQTASSAFDASVSRGPQLGGANSVGLSKGASNGDVDTKELGTIEPPSPEEKSENKTPYQNLIYAGMAALMIGQTLVQAAGKFAGQAQKTMNPAEKPQLIAIANALAVAAMAAGAAAAAIGAQLSSEYNQTTQAMPFIMGGAVIIAQAAIVVVMAEMAAAEAQSGVASAALDAAMAASQSLGQMGQMAGAMGGGDEKTPQQKREEERKKREAEIRQRQSELRNRQIIKDSTPDLPKGDIKGPGVPE